MDTSWMDRVWPRRVTIADRARLAELKFHGEIVKQSAASTAGAAAHAAEAAKNEAKALEEEVLTPEGKACSAAMDAFITGAAAEGGWWADVTTRTGKWNDALGPCTAFAPTAARVKKYSECNVALHSVAGDAGDTFFRVFWSPVPKLPWLTKV